MQHRIRNRRLGFTLTELAIVMAVVGVLAAGLFNLISGANTQTRDAAAANQQQQLIDAVKAYLASDEGTNIYLRSLGVNTSGGIDLPLPSTNHTAGDTNCGTDAPMSGVDPGLCAFLPAGFSGSTTNSYNEIFSIRVLRDGTAANTVPQTYSFMILAWSPTAVSSFPLVGDASGARIASLIGGDGGFIYTAPVCTAAASQLVACGSYGTWSSNVNVANNGYNFPVAKALNGDIVSRTYVSPEANFATQWLARLRVPSGDTTYALNTMTMPEYLGAQPLIMGSPVVGSAVPAVAGLYMGAYGSPAPTTGGTNLYMSGGTITGTGTSNINLVNSSKPAIPAVISLSTACSSLTDSTCPPAILISAGDISMPNGELNANTLYAGTFIYQSSDLRLKSNVHPLANSLDTIMRLKPVSFDFKASNRSGLGVIAQDIETVYPQLVSQARDGTKAVNYDGLIAPLIDAVQELKKENDQLRQQINAQTMREDDLEQQLKRQRAP